MKFVVVDDDDDDDDDDERNRTICGLVTANELNIGNMGPGRGPMGFHDRWISIIVQPPRMHIAPAYTKLLENTKC